MAASPPITAILGFFIMKESINIMGVFGMSITIAGIAMVILNKNPEDKKMEVKHSVKGLTYAFLGAVVSVFGVALLFI
ncbi:TPA: hypothetical protein QCR75_005739 [Bacillus anthracis]|nr:hypothetical protein [Bacillus anthracis]